MLIRSGEIPDGRLADIRVMDGRIVGVGVNLVASDDEEVIDADGGAVLPGFHDHHVHLRAVAAALISVHVGAPDVRTRTDLRQRLLQADRERAPGDWLRAVDYHESTVGDLDRDVLDDMLASRPVRVQHATGMLWVLNSAALRAIGAQGPTPDGVERDAAGRPTGRVWREDEWLRRRWPAPLPDLGAVGRAGAAAGITGFTDATPDQSDADLADLASATGDGRLPQTLHLAAPAAAHLPPHTRATLGPVKVVLDDDRLPDPDSLAQRVRDAHRAGRPVAIHCVTRIQAVIATAAINQAGPGLGDRIEHGAVLGPDLLPELFRLGLTVVTQPAFVWSRGDRYLSEVDPAEHADLWRLASLRGAGIAVAASTDAPFGPLDPLSAVQAATNRLTRDGQPLGRRERLSARSAVALFSGRPGRPASHRRIHPGEPGDLCILNRPLEDAVADPTASPIVATLIGGRVAYRAD